MTVAPRWTGSAPVESDGGPRAPDAVTGLLPANGRGGAIALFTQGAVMRARLGLSRR
jgi:hypothetical protein